MMQFPRVRSATLDRFEQVIIVLLWLWLAFRVALSSHPFALLLLASEAAVVIFVLLRRPTDAISTNPRDWLLACAATALPMLVEPIATRGFLAAGVVLLLLGNLWQLTAKLFLRRSFGVAPANRGVKVDGPYRLMRHPIYAGYLVTHIGILLMMPSLWNFAVYAAAWVLQIYRLLAEEQLLSADPVYATYQERVRYRLLPGLF